MEIGKPIPTSLRKILSEVLEKRDYAGISIKPGMASESTIRDLLNGSKVSKKSLKTVNKLISSAIEKCEKGSKSLMDKRDLLIKMTKKEKS